MPRYLTDSVPGRQRWPLAIAHRGADTQRENTLAAFQNAVNIGFGYLELDVRTTADGLPVVFHDETLDRITTGSGYIADLTWDQISQFKVVGEYPGQQTEAEVVGEPILLFEDLLTAFPNVNLNVDLKDLASAESVATVVSRYDAWDRVLVAAFQDEHRQGYQDHAKRLTGGVVLDIAYSGGVKAVAALVLAQHLPRVLFQKVVDWLRRDGPLHAVQVPMRRGPIRVVTPHFVSRCQAVGLAVHVWVIDEPGDMEELLAMGVDGLVTDDAVALAAVMGARGQWPQR